MSCYKLVAYLENTTLEATTYYIGDGVIISSQHISVDEQVIRLADIRSYDVQTKAIGLHWRWEYLLAFVTLGLLVIGALVSLWRLVEIISSGGSIAADNYITDWRDFLFPVAVVAATLVFMFIIKRPKVLMHLNLVPQAGEAGQQKISRLVSCTTLMEASNLTQALRKALHTGPTSDNSFVPRPIGNEWPEPVIYEDDNAYITDSKLWLAGKVYTVAPIQAVRVKQQSQRLVWAIAVLIWLGLIAFYTVRSLVTLFSAPAPALSDSGLWITQSWLLSVAFILLQLGFLYRIVMNFLYMRSMKKLSGPEPAPKDAGHVYSLIIQGKFGRYNKDVILSETAFTTSDKQQADNIKSAIEWAIYRQTANLEHGGLRREVVNT